MENVQPFPWKHTIWIEVMKNVPLHVWCKLTQAGEAAFLKGVTAVYHSYGMYSMITE